MWIIPFLPEKLPGQVFEKKSGGQLLISPLISGLPLTDQTVVQRFFAPDGNNASTGNYVIFRWKRPGERGFDQIRKDYGDPRAVEIEVIEEEQAKELAENIRNSLSEKLRNQLHQQQEKLQQEIEKVNQQAENLAISRTQDLMDKLQIQEESLANRESTAQEELQKLEKKQALLEALTSEATQAKVLWQSLEPYRAAIPLVKKEESDFIADGYPLTEDLGGAWNKMIESDGLLLPKYVGTSYLLSLIASLYSGSLILLNGSVGVGKTSLISSSAGLLGGKSKIIPVRPAWLDSSDLLGFFDPLSETFRPSSFLTALKDAKQHSDQIHLVCLDELNLAKIENYGADLLSALEYSRIDSGKQGLLLYSESIETDLWEEARHLNDEQSRDRKQSHRLKRIQNILSDYPSNFFVPKNLVLVGTLNADETTYDLSPKVIDRSFVITYPPAELTSDAVSKTREIQTLSQTLSVSKIFNQLEDRIGANMAGWEKIVKWNVEYISKLGIPLGHRAKRDYAIFIAVASYLGLTQEECIGHFLVRNEN